MEQAWKRASVLFSAAAVFYGLGLVFDLSYIIQYNLDYCFGNEDYYCHMENQPKYSLFGGLIVSGSLAKVSFDQSKRIADPNKFTLGIPKANTLNQYSPTTELGIGHVGVAYFLGLANFFLLFLPSIDMLDEGMSYMSIIIHILLTIFYLILYKGEFFAGLALSAATVVVIIFLIFATEFSDFSIFLLVLGGLAYLLTIIINHARGLHGISLGLLYGGPFSFVGAVFVIALLFFGEL